MLRQMLTRCRLPFIVWTLLATFMFQFLVHTLLSVAQYSENDAELENLISENSTAVEKLPSVFKTVIWYFLGTKNDDPELVEHVRDKIIMPPSSKPYNLFLPNATDSSQDRQSEVLDNILLNMTNGFFVEAGAHDGESLSNTLYFERFRNWTGLLVEADADLFRVMQTKNRKAYVAHSCLSPKNTAELYGFTSAYFNGHITTEGETADQRTQCVPLYTFMLALNRSHIDLFSLDIEGDELEVLKTIPWDKLQIRVLLVEFALIEEGKDGLIEYMSSIGYSVIKEFLFDVVFGKQDNHGNLIA